GSEDVVLLRQRVEEGIFREQAAGPVQEHDGLATATFEHSHFAAAPRGQGFDLHRATSAPPSVRSGWRRFAIGLIHQRWSSFHSGQTLRSFGMTFSAKSFVEWRVFSSGMLPT